MNFWIGFILGSMFGGTIGLFITALLVVGKRADPKDEDAYWESTDNAAQSGSNRDC